MTERLEAWVRTHFQPADVPDVLAILEKDVPSGYAPETDERIQAAVALYSRGDTDEFLRAVMQAQADWRDILVMAGLANEGWPELLDEILGPRH